MKRTSQNQMMKLITNYCKKLCKSMGKEEDFKVVVDGRNKKNIALFTDGWIFTVLFDPSLNEMPYLIREANAEFGHNAKVPSGYEDQEKFGKFIQKHGWDYEPYGMGEITIYPED